MMKILILKFGYSETLDPEMGKIVSLGDVVRCTCALEALREKYSDAHITWVVSNEASPLVLGNKYIDRVVVWDEFVPFALMREQYDLVVNLEKLQGVCALVDMINAWEKVGFRFNAQSGGYDAYEHGSRAIEYIKEKAGGNTHHQIWQKIIIEMIGCEWKGQEYSLGYTPNPKERYRVGLNYLVGSKWPTKAMSKKKWEELASMLEERQISYSWQQGTGNLYEYMDWIAGCDILVTSDSLGLHLALAMQKKVIGIFGATSDEETYFYERGVSLKPKQDHFACMPCYKPNCVNKEFCMDAIELDRIMQAICIFEVK